MDEISQIVLNAADVGPTNTYFLSNQRTAGTCDFRTPVTVDHLICRRASSLNFGLRPNNSFPYTVAVAPIDLAMARQAGVVSVLVARAHERSRGVLCRELHLIIQLNQMPR